MKYEEKMAKLRARAQQEESAKARQELQERRAALKHSKAFSLSQINRILLQEEQRAQRRAKQWEGKGYPQPIEVAEPDLSENSN
ncbi:MAG: hypothetical protein ABSH32_24395 [Bryobacteraceae bacterium]|jgi:hypothetical protein